MDMMIMRDIVEKDIKRTSLKCDLDLLNDYKERPYLYGAGVEVTISSGPSFHDQWTSKIKSKLDKDIVDTLINSIEIRIKDLDEQIEELENKLKGQIKNEKHKAN